MTDDTVSKITVGAGDDAREIAVLDQAGAADGPGLMFLGGFRSDMRGSKAEALAAWASAHSRRLTRFDYSGHGASGGRFEDGTIGRWLDEAKAVFEAFAAGPTILVGSSMGGWLSLLLAAAFYRRHGADTPVRGLVLVAPAPDFTEALMWAEMSEETRTALMEDGRIEQPSDYSDEPYLITRALIEDGRNHLLLGGTIETGCPVHILQGVLDADVPWRHAFSLVDRLATDDVVVTLIKDGDHRLSRPQDLARLIAAVESIDG